LGGLLGGAKVPKQQPPVRMPVPDDNQAKEAAQRKQQELLAARGRQSTDLSGENDKLGQ